MSYIKELQKRITEINLQIQRQQGDVNELQAELNKLMLAEFEEEMREENSQQLLKG